MFIKYQDHSLELIREKLTNTVLLTAAGFAGVALIGSLSRIPDIGFIPVMWVQIACSSLLVLFYLFRKSLSRTTKAYAISMVFFIAGVAGIQNLGISGGGIYLIIGASIYSSFMLSIRVAVTIAVSGALVLLYYTRLVWLHQATFEVEQSLYNLTVSSWLTSTLTYGFIITIALFLIQHFLHYLQLLINDKQNTIDSQTSEIEQSDAILQTVINHLPYGIAWKDKQLRYLGANQVFLDNLNIDKIDHLVGKTDFDLMSTLRAKKLVNFDKNIVDGSQAVISYQEKEIAENNTLTFKNVTHLPLNSRHQEMSGVLTSYCDITEIKNLELKAKQAQEQAEKASLSKSQFLANMSHEIRTPINGVLGLLDLCLQTGLTPVQTKYLSQANFSAKLLLQIINDVLDLSKIESGHFELEQHFFCIEDLLSQLDNLFSSQAINNNIKFETQLLGKQRVSLIGDPTRVMQILMNLCSNAIKFTQHGKVLVFVMVVADEQAAKVKVTIKDTGVGISDESIPHLFDKFTQADETITRKYGGTGLGLSIVKQLVEAMKSKIMVNSVVGEGTEFSFVLQLAVGKEKRVHNARKNYKQDLKNKRLLLVEDNLINQEVAKSILDQSGAVVTVANDGQQALDLMHVQKFDLVLLDVQMPVLDGCSALKLIRRNRKWNELPVVALTANVFADEVAHYMEIGFTDHLGKPFSREELLDKVAKYI